MRVCDWTHKVESIPLLGSVEYSAEYSGSINVANFLTNRVAMLVENVYSKLKKLR
jgi:hypothetical protein